MARDPGTGSRRQSKSIYRKPLPSEPKLEAVGYNPPPNTPAQMRQIRAEIAANAAVRQAAPDIAASRVAAPGAAISGYAALSALLGPNVAARVPGTLTAQGTRPTHTALGTGVDIALSLPFLRGPRAVAKGAAAVARGAKATEAAGVAKATLREPAVRGAVRDVKKAYRARTLKVNDLEQQLPKARSRITQTVVEKPADAASRRLEQSDLAKRIPGVRLGTASERVTKAAGRAQRLERGRVQASMANEMNSIKSVKAGSPEDVANFWYAQLPKAARSPAGLRAVQNAQRQHLEYLASGKALADANAREQAVNAAMATAETDAERLKLLNEREQIKLYKTDIPAQIQDVTGSLAQLEDVIARAPKPNEQAIAAVRALGEDSARVLIDAGRLNPARVEPRKGIVSQFAGMTPTGEEAYIGHRLATPDTRFPYTPRGGTGRVATPKGMVSENKLVLAKTGRLRPSLRVAAEDWQSVQVFRSANKARDDLGKLGTKFPGYVPKDHVLVNPKGRTVPPNWKTDELAQFQDGYEDINTIRAKAQQIIDEFAADGSDPQAVERLKQSALEQGVSWDELRVVPKRLVDRYYGQFRPSTARGKYAKGYDALVDATAASIVFARVGYIPKNIVQNLIMAAPHQGAFLLPNAVRAAQAMADPQLRHLLQAEVGFTGPSGAVSREAMSKKALGAAAGFVGKVADDPIRMAAFMHEAAAEGVISKVNPLLNARDRRALLRLLTDESQRPLLNDIRARSVEAMADFSRLTPDQARVARRILIIPGWLMAGSRYPFHFAATHPIRSALLAYIALGEPGQSNPWNRRVDKFFTGTSYKRGIQIGDKRLRTGSLNPVTTPWELGASVAGSVRGRTGPFDYSTPTAFDYANPFASFLVSAAQGEGVGRSAQRLAPNYSLIHDLVHPAAKASYPEDATRAGRLKRELGIVPIQVNDSTASVSRSRSGPRSRSIYQGGGSSGSPSKSIYRR